MSSTGGSQASLLTGKIVALLASLSAISVLSTNIILPAFPAIGVELGVPSRELGLASAMLGFLTMEAAALTTWLGSALTFPAVTTLGGIQVTQSLDLERSP